LAWYTRDKRISEFAVDKTLTILRKEGVECEKIEKAKGYDILLQDGRKVEVKFDTWIWSTGNISAEWWVDEKKGTKGWAQYSDADIMVYLYDFDNAYVLDMQRIKNYIHENQLKLKPKKAYKVGAVNLMVPISDVRDLRLVQFEAMFKKYSVLPAKD
jgi:hypothetical protein